MSLTETVIGGTLNADGTLTLDDKPNLTPGRVTVVLRSEVVHLPADDPFWQRMAVILAIPRTGRDDGGAATLTEVEQSRQQWEEHQREIERLQGEGGS
ncbi:hypothetical protein [Fimbriiglobus ruber]|uniref:Uncharacterized protein n=1 Tax=Fimbriiglobus ruber TaxID=1908690 RepID=A0A225DS87_9BACT|nr:hypothetical protein [Fimbriiglobus ruber]OWK44320.1 hypothetical protein FRUB_02252 [Fimbriiglobus ruber]